MCRFAIGYHHICPLPMRGTSKGGCGRKFFAALEFVSEWKAIRKVMEQGGETGQVAVRAYLKAKTREEGWVGWDWSELRTLPLDEMCDRLACADLAHGLDRWDYWEPTQEEHDQGVQGKVFRMYCSNCDFHVPRRSRIPNDPNLPEDIDFKKCPPFAIGGRRFDDRYLTYKVMDKDEWRAPNEVGETCEDSESGEEVAESASGVSAASSGRSESAVSAMSRLPLAPKPPPAPPRLDLPYRTRRDDRRQPSPEGNHRTPLGDLSEESEHSDGKGGEPTPSRSRRTAAGQIRRPRRPSPDLYSGQGGHRGLHDGSQRPSNRLRTPSVGPSDVTEASASTAPSFI